jgi:hypothetical protein
MSPLSHLIMTKKRNNQGRRSHNTGTRNRGNVSGGGPTTRIWNTSAMAFPNAGRLLHSDNVPHNVWQTVEFGNLLTSSSGAEVDLAKTFRINDVQGIASWLAVFDQYKIQAIEVWITPSSSTQINVDNFRWLSVVDYDDNVTPSFNQLLQYSNVSDAGRTEGVYRRFRPHMATVVQSASGTVAGHNTPSGFIDSAYQAVEHYGVKISMSATSTSVVLAMRARYHLVFRNNI